MPTFLAALAVAATVAAQPASAEAPAELAFPNGAPRDDYGLVSWCYGALRGYLDLYDQVMPEVRRIETTWRRPGSNLAEDMAAYGKLRRQGQSDLKDFARAMEAAEKASLRPINAQGAEAVKKGRSTWAAAGNLTKARLAQEWMSWSLPARCQTTAASLEQRAKLMGTAFKVEPDADPLASPEAGLDPAAAAGPEPAAPAGPEPEPATP